MSRKSLFLISAVSGWVSLQASTAMAQSAGCSTATELGDVGLGTLALPYTLNGSLDSTPEMPDIDFYRITGATPGTQLAISFLRTDTPTVTGSLIGIFDGLCNLSSATCSPIRFRRSARSAAGSSTR